MRRSVETRSILASMALALIVMLSGGTAATGAEALHVKLAERRIEPGVRTVIISVYATPEGEDPIASETRSVRIDKPGLFSTPLGDLVAAVSDTDTRWLAVRLPPGKESQRIPLSPRAGRSVIVNVVPQAVITGVGLVESTEQGFRFPDGTVQTSAATVSGGVPSVNGIGGAVTITGGGSASVQTVGSTITVTAPPFGAPVAVGATNADGVASTIARSDHVHAHGNQSGGSLHATATTSSAGFLSATDKQKLDGAVKYNRTIVVSKVVGDTVASGTALLDALNGITGNNATNPFLLKIEPGVYDIGASQLAMKTFVDIEGSGANVTFILASRGGTLSSSSAAVVGTTSSELRLLTVTNTAPGTAIGIGFFASSSSSVREVTINSSGASQDSIGVFAINTSGAGPAISDATVNATSTGGTSGSLGVRITNGGTVSILNSRITAKGVGGTGTNIGISMTSNSSNMTVDGCTILATGDAGQNTGVSVGPGTATIMSSTVQVETAGSRAAVSTSASPLAILNIFHSRLLALGSTSNPSQVSIQKGNSSIVRVATSQIDSASSGVPKCVHVYSADMNDLNNVCPAPVI